MAKFLGALRGESTEFKPENISVLVYILTFCDLDFHDRFLDFDSRIPVMTGLEDVCVCLRLVVITGMQYYAQKTVKPKGSPQNGREDDVGALGTHDDVTPESRPLSHHIFIL